MEIRAGTYLEMFDENPTYNYNYKAADDTEQTYLSLEEARNDGVVTGMYSYVDPLVSCPTLFCFYLETRRQKIKYRVLYLIIYNS